MCDVVALQENLEIENDDDKNTEQPYILKHSNPQEVIDAIRAIHQTGYYHTDLFEQIALKEASMPDLKDRELEFLKLCCRDLSYAEIAHIRFDAAMRR